MSQVVTGEAVALDLRPARLPSRMLAAALDIAIQLVLLAALGGLAAAAQLELDDAAAAAISLSVLVAVLVGYPVALETLYRGRTLGKAALGLRVVRDDGGPIAFRHALMRALVGTFVERPGLLLPLIGLFLGLVTQLVNRRGKRLGDLWAGTMVLQERVPVRGVSMARMPPQLAHWATTLDLSRLGDDLALSARQYLGRADELTPAAREDLGRRLTSAVLASTTPPPPPGTPGWAYLSAVLAERRRRDEERLRRESGQRTSGYGYGGGGSGGPAYGRTFSSVPPVPPEEVAAPADASPIDASPIDTPAASSPAGGFAPPG